MGGWFLIGIVVLIFLANAIKIVQEYERGVIFRLGRLVGARGPGLFFILPMVDRMVKVNMRTVTFDVNPQELITRDNVPVKVNAVVYFRVLEPTKAIVEIDNYQMATMQIAQTTLRGVLGQAQLDELLSERDKLNQSLQSIIDEQTDPWGVKVSIVELKEVELPENMRRAMARQAEAERNRRAKIINAEGEFQASEKLLAASKILEQSPLGIQLRYLQTAIEISAEKNSTLVFPLPMDLLGHVNKFLESRTIKPTTPEQEDKKQEDKKEDTE